LTESSFPSFVRGDVDNSGQLDLSDCIRMIASLFGAEESAQCLPTLDVNGGEKADLADMITLLAYMFMEGTPPAGEFPECETLPRSSRCPVTHQCL
jgi:hypothetical protein